MRTASSQRAGCARGLSGRPGTADPAGPCLLALAIGSKPASKGTGPARGAPLRPPLCLAAPGPGGRRTGGIQLLPTAVCQPRQRHGRARGPPRRRPRPCEEEEEEEPRVPDPVAFRGEATQLLEPRPCATLPAAASARFQHYGRQAGCCPASLPPFAGTYLKTARGCEAPLLKEEEAGSAKAEGNCIVAGWRGENGGRGKRGEKK